MASPVEHMKQPSEGSIRWQLARARELAAQLMKETSIPVIMVAVRDLLSDVLGTSSQHDPRRANLRKVFEEIRWLADQQIAPRHPDQVPSEAEPKAMTESVGQLIRDLQSSTSPRSGRSSRARAGMKRRSARRRSLPPRKR